MIYTGIGSRETPVDVLDVMCSLAYVLAGEGWTLNSGGAPGADQAFEAGAFAGKGQMNIFLPWKSFEEVNRAKFKPLKADLGQFEWPNPDERAFDIAAKYHPNWSACTWGAKKFHARNVHQILGHDLILKEGFTRLVVCWTKEGKGTGGTGQALRIAADHQIPIVDFGWHTDLRQALYAIGEVVEIVGKSYA